MKSARIIRQYVHRTGYFKCDAYFVYILLDSLNNKKRLARYTNVYDFIEKLVFSTNYKLVQSTGYFY